MQAGAGKFPAHGRVRHSDSGILIYFRAWLVEVLENRQFAQLCPGKRFNQRLRACILVGQRLCRLCKLAGVKQALAFLGLHLNPRPLPPGFVTKLLQVREKREHVGERNRLPSSAGLLAKEHDPDDGYEGVTLL